MHESGALITLNPYEARLAAAIFDRLFPAGETWPAASDMGVCAYLDRALAGPYSDLAETYRVGLSALDLAARQAHGRSFCDCAAAEQGALLAGLEDGTLGVR